MDELSDLEVVGRIMRNATDEVQIKIGTYWNIEVVDIRWYKNNKPSKGIRLNKKEAKTLLEILERELNE